MSFIVIIVNRINLDDLIFSFINEYLNFKKKYFDKEDSKLELLIF